MIEEDVKNEMPFWGKTRIKPQHLLAALLWLVLGMPLILCIFHRVREPLALVAGLGRRAA